MAGPVLVTGATGTLGRPTVARLRAAGHDVRSLSRRTGPGLVTGDLLTGSGLAEALDGVRTVVNLATGPRQDDVAATRNLVTAAAAAGVGHLVHISIVGIDEIPLPYYRMKLGTERVVEGADVPSTILRATQFHTLIETMFRVQRRLPVVVAPAFAVQPIAAEEVADRLAELAGAAAAGRAPDIGGPAVRPLPELARAVLRASGTRRPVAPVRLPGRIFRAYAAGHGLVPGRPYGRTTFEDFLAERYGSRAVGP
jgi:uncharacterized protein YbjT (DUF2867 family)